MRTILLFLLPISAFLTSCVSTPVSRIQDNPGFFNRLSNEHQNLVSQGKIDRGMSKPAVFLAMGNPDSKTVGEQHGEHFERWNYNTLIPVYSHGFSPYYGRSGCRGGYYDPSFHRSVHYEPRPEAQVNFRENKVTGWSRKRYNF